MIFAGVGAAVGGERDRPVAGLFLGLFFGPIGWIIAALLPPSVSWEVQRARDVAHELDGRSVVCSWCLMRVKAGAKGCHHCGREFEQPKNKPSRGMPLETT